MTMKKTYIKPFVSVDELEHEIEILAGSPQVEVRSAADDSGVDLSSNPGGTGNSGSNSVGKGDGDDALSKKNLFDWDEEW